MRRVIALAALLAACGGEEGGVLVDVTQGPGVSAPVDTLHLFVGTPDEATGGFAGVAVPDDVITLAAPLAGRTHTVQLVRADGMDGETPVRVAVVGLSGGPEGEPVGLAVVDVPRIPGDVFLRYAAVLEPIGGVVVTDSGCLLLADGTVVGAVGDRDCDGWTEDEGDCDDLDPAVHPEAYDACAGASLGVDDDCNGTADDGDKDGDLATCLSDCDDEDPARTPGKLEDCVNGIDDDCDLEIDEGVPEICDDGIDNDCDPATLDTSGVEVCGDGFDNDCDMLVDEGRDGDPDVDGDGSLCADDCNDDVEAIHPGADEKCNQTDDDCDQAVDEGVNEDQDGALCAFDCDDLDPDRFPGNPEVCDTVDNDCDEATLPVARPCVSAGSDPCLFGFRACNEELGTYGDQCVIESNDVPLPPGACADLACEAQASDGISCGAEPPRACTQFVDGDGAVCEGAQHALTAPNDPLQCTWQILGGQMQQGWTVGLLAEGSTVSQPIVTTCNATFVVEAIAPGGQPGQFAVVLVLSGVYDHTEVFTIVPEHTGACPVPSLVCDNSGG